MRRTRGISLLLLAVLLAAACGGKGHRPGIASAAGGRGAGASPTPSVDPTEQMRQFAQCMRDHGVDMADPDSGANGGSVRITASEGSQATGAMQACQRLLPVGKLATPDPQQVEQMRQYAQCMRDHGVDMADPDPNGGLNVSKSGGNGTEKVDPDDAAFKAADEACASKLPGKHEGGGLRVGGGK